MSLEKVCHLTIIKIHVEEMIVLLFLLPELSFPILELYINAIVQYILICVWFLLLSIIFHFHQHNVGWKVTYSLFLLKFHRVTNHPSDALNYGRILLHLLFIFVTFLTYDLASSIQWTDLEVKRSGFCYLGAKWYWAMI